MTTDTKLRALTSLNQTEYRKILNVFSQRVSQKCSTMTLKGKRRVYRAYKEHGNSSLYGSHAKLDFILMYLKENPNQAYHGACFGMTQSKVSEWVRFLLPVLQETLHHLGYMPQSMGRFKANESYDYLLVDVTERIVPRRCDAEGQSEEYSGKKKLHTCKHLAIGDSAGYIHYMTPAYQGSIHDKTIWNDLNIQAMSINLLADLGFQGAQHNHPNIILPYKTPKNAKLTDLQKQINQVINSLRVRIEHAFAGVKRLKIIRNKIRLRTEDVRDSVMMIATALHNLRVDFRKPLISHS
ncbi:transposase family protein [Chondrinema litorale]|uniref:transposase family protein n=1 Tax=Chondrinema litorale TaxID=2994555 RepID=UPI0025428823|nr:transposase family protein [Chondrinema litorale]UZR99285.1 transposase family protein [Chondrinema litorale]